MCKYINKIRPSSFESNCFLPSYRLSFFSPECKSIFAGREKRKREIDLLKFMEEKLYGDYWGALKSIVHDDMPATWIYSERTSLGCI